jgi:hypothetical protein
VIDVKNARYTGLLAESTVASPGAAAQAMLFDTYNPWAALVQLNSTHPLTGRRVAHLGEIAKEKGQGFADYDVEAAAARVHLDRGKLWGQFLGELLLLVAPLLFGLVGIMGAGSSRRRPSPLACSSRFLFAIPSARRNRQPSWRSWAIPALLRSAGSRCAWKARPSAG